MRQHLLRLAPRLAVGAAALLLAGVGLAPAPVAAASGGSLSGRVIDAQGAPLEGICISLDNGPGAQSGEDGTYSIEGIAPGSVKVQFADCGPSPRFVTQWYLGHRDWSSADAVVVADGLDTPLGDVALAEGVVVRGTVTDSTGSPIPGIGIGVNATEAGGSAAWTQSGVDGTYATSPLPVGSYKVQFSDTTSPPAWARQYWHDEPSWNTAETLTLASADIPTRTGVDATLAPAATIFGTVTGPDAAPLGGICVEAMLLLQGNTEWLQGTSTAPDGTYTLTELPAGDVRVHFRPCNGGQYVEEWYADSSDPSSATPVVLDAGDARTGIDAQLDTGITVSGHVSDPDGSPIAGIGVSVNPDGPGSGAWAQTDANGDYTTGALRPGTYRVQFQGSGTWATQYWDHQISWNRADLLVLAPSDAPGRVGVDATLTEAATVTGTVTESSGDAAPGVCVSATVDGPDGLDWVGGTTTGQDGSYTIAGLPATPVKVVFDDCNGVGPYLRQWYRDAPDPSTAQVLELAPGATASGVDARLAPASEITGTVTDGDGTPVAGVCVQASTASAVGSLARTNDDGRYAVILSAPGAYDVQFVDCTDAPRFAAQWWRDAARQEDATPVVVGEASIVTDIDAQLAAGATGSISGRVVNVAGAPVTTSCVVLYLPNQYALFAPVDAEGRYSIAGAPSGTYALAFLGCPSEQGEPSPIVPDPQIADVAYRAAWWDDVPLELTSNQTDGGPDPIAQGANLVTITPGAQLDGYDHCFGCTAVRIEHLEADTGSVTASFSTPGLVDDTEALVAAQSAASDYELSCRSGDGATATSSGSASPLTVALGPGTYACRVSAREGSVTIATSAPESVTVTATPGATPPAAPSSPGAPTGAAPGAPGAPSAPGAPTSPAGTSGTGGSGNANATPSASAVTPPERVAALAFTGSGDTARLLVTALAGLVVGVGCLTASRRRRAPR